MSLFYDRDLLLARLSDVCRSTEGCSPAERIHQDLDPLRWHETARDRDTRLIKNALRRVCER